jgi:glyoxylase-like metal-dependent hydrolase (beta-lactamase superfamily II)
MKTLDSIDAGVLVTEVALGEYDVRGVLLVGDTRAVVWDTLSHPRDMSGWLPLIGSRELVVVYSHADWDHIWGTAGLPLQRTTIVMGHRECQARFTDDVPRTLRERQLAEPGQWDEVVLIAPDTVFDAETTVDLGSMTLELHHLPGHTPDTVVGFVPERGLLLTGDTAETPFPVVPPDGQLAEWVAGLERWERDPRVRTVVPAHGPIGGIGVLQKNIRYLRGLLDGRPLPVTGPLTEFYRKTHETNQGWAAAGARVACTRQTT